MDMKVRLVCLLFAIMLISIALSPYVSAVKMIDTANATYFLEENTDSCLINCKALVRVDLKKDVIVDSADFQLSYIKLTGNEQVLFDKISILDTVSKQKKTTTCNSVPSNYYYDLNASIPTCASFGGVVDGVTADCVLTGNICDGATDSFEAVDVEDWVDIAGYFKLKKKDSPFYFKLETTRVPLLGLSGLDWQMNAFGDDLSEWEWFFGTAETKLEVPIFNSSSTGLIDYQKLVDLNSDISNDFWSGLRSDCHNLRIANSDENAELDYDRLYCDTTGKVLRMYVRVDQIPVGARSIYLYLEPTSDATDYQDKNSTWLKYEDFDDCSDWTLDDQTDSGYYVCGNGQLLARLLDRNDGDTHASFDLGYTVNDFRFLLDINPIACATCSFGYMSVSSAMGTYSPPSCDGSTISLAESDAVVSGIDFVGITDNGTTNTGTLPGSTSLSLSLGTYYYAELVYDTADNNYGYTIYLDSNFTRVKENRATTSSTSTADGIYDTLNVAIGTSGNCTDAADNAWVGDLNVSNARFGRYSFIDSNSINFTFSGTLQTGNNSPDVNITLIDGTADTLPIELVFGRDGNATITVSVDDLDASADLILDLNYNSSKAEGGTVIINDLNLTAYGGCSDTNFVDGSTCTWDWDFSGVADGNYFIIANVSDGTATDWNASDYTGGIEINQDLPDLNITLLDGFNDALPLEFGFGGDMTITISFTAQDYDLLADLVVDLNYNTSAALGGTTIINDLNLMTYANCSDNNFWATQTCTYDWDYSAISDGNYFITAVLEDRGADTQTDFSTYATGFDLNHYPALLSITNIDGSSDALPLYFKYSTDGNLTITFVPLDLDLDTDLVLDLNFNTSKALGGTTIIDDLNLMSYSGCGDLNFVDGSICTWDWNISGVADNNYFLVASLFDGVDTAIDYSDLADGFVLDETAPTCSSDVNAFWQTGDANIVINCADVTAGMKAITYRLDSNRRSTISLGSWTAFDTNVLISGDGNYSLVFIGTDMADNNSVLYDTNFVLIDSTAPVVDITSHNNGESSSLDVITFTVLEINDVVMTFTVNGGASDFVQATDCALTTNTWTCSFTQTGFNPEVDYTLVATAVDENGFSGSESLTFRFVDAPITPTGGTGSSSTAGDSTAVDLNVLPAVDETTIQDQGVLSIAEILRSQQEILGYRISQIWLLSLLGLVICIFATKDQNENTSKKIWVIYVILLGIGWFLALFG